AEGFFVCPVFPAAAHREGIGCWVSGVGCSGVIPTPNTGHPTPLPELRRPPMTVLPTAPVDLDLRSLLQRSGPEAAAARLLALHPVEMAEALEGLDPDDRYAVFRQLPDSAAARLLLHVDAEFRGDVIGELPPAHLAHLLDRLPVDEAGSLLAQLPEERR